MQTPPTEEEQFTQLGQRLALLLSAASMPDDVKASWAELVPHMTLEQMDTFAKALEENIAGVATQELKKLSDAVEVAKTRQAAEEQAAIAKANQALDENETLLAKA